MAQGKKAGIILGLIVAGGAVFWGGFTAGNKFKPAAGKTESLPEVKRTADDYIIADMGAEKIYFSEVERIAQTLNRFLKDNFENSPQWRMNFVQQYVAQRAISKRAAREGADKEEEFIFNLENARQNILANKLIRNALSKIKTTETDFKKYYNENKARYQIKGKIKLSYIKLDSKESAEKVAGLLNKGTRFDRAGKAVKASEWIMQDSPPMGIPGLSNISGQVLTELFSLAAGASSGSYEISGPEKEKSAFYVFHIDEKELAKDTSFEEARKQVESDYVRSAQEKGVNDFIMETFALEKVKIHEDKVLAPKIGEAKK